jgi:nuclear pore complex protein Nup188
VPILKHLAEPFGTPSDASKAKLDKTAVTLADKVELKVDDTDRKLALALSAKYNIDQVQALILTRSFIYNHGLSRPDLSGQEKEKESKVEEFVETITPFYYTERLSVLRSIIPLFRANEEPGHPINEVADEFLPLIIGTGPSFVTSILTEYQKKTQSPPPTKLLSNPHESARWSKQNFKEQLILLEILFWSLWSFVACDGPTVVRVFETAYSTRIGTAQENAALMVDAESSQLRQDGTAMWVLIMLEVLELERVAQPGGLSLAADPDSPPLYWSSAEHLQRIHELVCTNQDGQYVCVYLAWAFVLARLNAVKAEMQSPLPSHQPFFDALVPANDRAFTGGPDAVPLHMARMCLSPEAGLFPFLHNLLTDSPLFVTSVAWKTGSAVTDPNAVAFRSVIKGNSSHLPSLASSTQTRTIQGC